MSHLRRSLTILLIALLTPLALISPPLQAAVTIAEPFREYYAQHQGMRLLGPPISALVDVDGFPAQYFEKGRLEDHRAAVRDPAWGIMFGRLVDHMIANAPGASVNNTSITYARLSQAAQPGSRHQPPAGFAGGVAPLVVGGARMVFIPLDPTLVPAPGYHVPLRFWSYINQPELFPGGWLHDVGLPLTDPLVVQAYKNDQLRTITMQAFERSVLTDDPLNPPGWQIERGNIGSDALPITMGTTFPMIDIPAIGARTTLPVHLLAHTGLPGDTITATLRWRDGTQVVQSFPVLPSGSAQDGRGLIIGQLDWLSPRDPPATQPAMIELRNEVGALVTQRQVLILGPGDPEAHQLNLYWVLGETVRPHPQLVVQTERIGTAALEALLWGPPRTQIGFTTALPTAQQVLAYGGRTPDWGPRVTLRSLTIVDGVATANFSRELRAYGGGSLRVKLIREQITRTLLQFPTVREVRIAIEGQTEGALEP